MSKVIIENTRRIKYPECKSWRIWLCALMCTLVANILCLPYWTDYGVMGFIRTPFNKEARIHISYTGVLTGAKAFSITSSEPSLGNPTNYSYGRGTQLCIADMPIKKEWRTLSLTLNVRSKGSILISLKGPYQCNDYGETYSIAVDYKNLWIGGKEVFSDQRKVTHAKDFSYRIQVNAGDAIKISFQARRHHFDAADFNLIKTKNFWYIVTLSILIFVISYILVQRIPTAACRCRRQEDAVFLFTFFLLLAVPVSMVSDAQKSTRERRILKQRPKVSSVFKESTNFGKEYDEWFCDHLGGRECFFKIHDVVERGAQEILRSPQAWYFQKSGWLFLAPFAWIPDMRLVRPIVKSFSDFKLFCDANHTKFYVLVVPPKYSIYQEHLYGYGCNRKNGVLENAFHEQMKQLAWKQHVTYIYPWTELRNASKKDFAYFKLTQHWTDWGAYVGYFTLMKEIRRDFPNIPVASLGDYNLTLSKLIRDDWSRNFHTGNLETLFGFEGNLPCSSAMYKYYSHKNADRLLLKKDTYTKEFVYGGGAYKIMLFGTSQCENLLNYLPYSAAKLKYIRINMVPLPGAESYKIMKNFKREILSYKPDIIIISVTGNSFQLPKLRLISTK